MYSHHVIVAARRATLLVAFASLALAGEPTLDETCKWLASKLIEEGGFRVSWSTTGRPGMSSDYTVSLKYKDKVAFSAQDVRIESHRVCIANGRYYEVHDQSIYTTDTIATFHLADLNAGSVKAIMAEERMPGDIVRGSNKHPAVAFRISKGKDRIEVTETFTAESDGRKSEPTKTTKETDSFALGFSDEDTAGRYAKALKHAIQLAGGQEEPF